MAEIVLAPCVEDELWVIWDYIAGDNLEAANRVIDAVRTTFGSLAENPAIGRRRRFRDSRLKDIRSWRVSITTSFSTGAFATGSRCSTCITGPGISMR